MPFVDILLLNYNSWRHTIECLESVMRLEHPDFRVLVCDNGSTDGSLERIRDWAAGRNDVVLSDDAPAQVRECVMPFVAKPIACAESDGVRGVDPSARVVLLALGRNGGFAAGNNAGMAFSRRDGRAKYIWLLNNDTVVAPDSLTELVRVAESDERIGAVGGSMLHYGDPEVVQYGSGATVVLRTGAVVHVNQGGKRRSAVDAASSDFNFVCGGCLLVRDVVVDKVGMLDERFFIYAEDSDFSLRISDAGWKMGYAARAWIWHKGGGTSSSGSSFHDYHTVRSALLFVHKWRPTAMPVAFAYWVVRAIAPKVMRGQWKRLPAVARAYRDVVRQLRSA